MTAEVSPLVCVGDHVAISYNSARETSRFDDLEPAQKGKMFILASALVNHLVRGTELDELAYIGVNVQVEESGIDMDLIAEFSSKIVNNLERMNLI